MGEVWEARDESLGRSVAVKVISMLAGGGSRGTEARARFLREARITAGLQHPNIVTIHDLGEGSSGDGKVPFLVMELVRGEGLDAKLRQGDVTARDAARWGAQICDALAEAHDSGIMHRDIKPSNILIMSSGFVKVLDFGVARAADPYATADRLTQTGFIIGTPPYMAPEQARGFAEPRSDLYALGCLLFELLTRQLPFQAPDTVGYLSAHLTQEPPAPSSVAPGIPPAWDDLVLTLLRKDPDQRYRNAADLAHALRHLEDPAQAVRHAPGVPPYAPGRTVPLPQPDGATFRARAAATATIVFALLCLPGLQHLFGKSWKYIEYRGALTELIAMNLVLSVVEMAMLAAGALLLFLCRDRGRQMIVIAGSMTVLHGLTAILQYQLAGGPEDVALIAHVIGPLTAVAALAAVAVAVLPATKEWCARPSRSARSTIQRALR